MPPPAGARGYGDTNPQVGTCGCRDTIPCGDLFGWYKEPAQQVKSG